MAHQLILILDFGGQHNQIMARKVRDQKVYCEIHPGSLSADEVKAKNPIGIILSPGAANAPNLDSNILELGVPVLGICYGAQLIAKALGGELKAEERDNDHTEASFSAQGSLFGGLKSGNVFMNCRKVVANLPQGFVKTASAEKCENAAFENPDKKIFGVLFHPHQSDDTICQEVFRSFIYDICKASGDWSMKNFAVSSVEIIKQKVGGGKALLALSGGVDSSVCAALMSKAIGKNLNCIFVDHGCMRKNEGDEIEQVFGGMGINFVRVDAEKRFLDKLKGVEDPEQKRKIIGEEFIRVFEEEAKKIGTVDFLVQGTIYPDIIESGIGSGLVKSHHNVGGLPDYVDFKEIIEPLRLLFKDEVRALGEQLGLDSKLVWRQPFPGPGLAVRCIGELTKERLDTLRDADCIFREEVAKAGLEREVSQYFAVLTPMKSVGVKNEKRTYSNTLALRAVKTTDFMTAQWVHLPYDLLETVSKRIVEEVDGINRIVYDITSKPPATIEWE